MCIRDRHITINDNQGNVFEIDASPADADGNAFTPGQTYDVVIDVSYANNVYTLSCIVDGVTTDSATLSSIPILNTIQPLYISSPLYDAAAVTLLNGWASRARGKTPPGEEPPWSARNYVPYWSQIISKEAQRGAAEEIVSRVREEVAAREATRARSG